MQQTHWQRPPYAKGHLGYRPWGRNLHTPIWSCQAQEIFNCPCKKEKKKEKVMFFLNLEFGTLIGVITTSHWGPILTSFLWEAFYWHSQKLVAKANTHPWRQKADSWLPGVRGGGNWDWLLMGMGLLSGVTECSGTRQWWWLRNPVNTLKTTELCTLKGWILHYVHFVSIKINLTRQHLSVYC